MKLSPNTQKPQSTAQRNLGPLPLLWARPTPCQLFPGPLQGLSRPETEGNEKCKAEIAVPGSGVMVFFFCQEHHLPLYYKGLSLSLEAKGNSFELGQWSPSWLQ